MRTQAELKRQLKAIDHKGYKAYKELEGVYDFGAYRLSIDHVQGDPFATPSRVRILYGNRGNIPPQYFETRHRRIAVEDYLLRRLHRFLKSGKDESNGNRANRRGAGQPQGSGKSGLVTACRAGQEILERTAMHITPEVIEARIEVGFPAYGRTIAAGELETILFDFLPTVAEKTFHMPKAGSGVVTNPGFKNAAQLSQMERDLEAVVALADDQQYIRDNLDKLGLVAFVADGAILPRESGISQKPMKLMTSSAHTVSVTGQDSSRASAIGQIAGQGNSRGSAAGQITGQGNGRGSAASQVASQSSNREPAAGTAVAFKSPESLAITLKLPHCGEVRGMGIKKGITVITGGGFHGKSTLLKALERGVYNHIAGDGRELVITEASAFKLRAEEGRCIHETDISLFINNLPTRADTTRFSTENASGSTSQAANTVEALSADCHVLLIDEDTSATNFMIRDERMARLVSDEKEPITPFIRKIRGIYDDLGVSTILVVGSSGDYLEVADTVLQMDCYATRDVTARAKELCELNTAEHQQITPAKTSGIADKTIPDMAKQACKTNIAEKTLEAVKSETIRSTDWLKKRVHTQRIEKPRTHGWDTLSLDKAEIDLRYLEQIVDESQTAAIAYLMQYILSRLADGKKTVPQLAAEATRKIQKDGILSVTPQNYPAGPAAEVRQQEILACLARYRRL